MSDRSYDHDIIATGVMVHGIRLHQDVLAQRKIDSDFADSLQEKVDACIALDIEQETLKALLKEKTAEAVAKREEMRKQAAEARKIIKMDIAQALWREFGIEDKR
ncbi:MAG: hypothetical protein LBC98_05130 [Prevotellaceae bacterium]|jgi:regulator of replication initiation timing|nr:hypothetical protein [Prevotellaceae bacterium]